MTSGCRAGYTITDADLDAELAVVHGGRELQESDAAALAARTLAEVRRRNLEPDRKSLSGDGSHSPRVEFRGGWRLPVDSNRWLPRPVHHARCCPTGWEATRGETTTWALARIRAWASAASRAPGPVSNTTGCDTSARALMVAAAVYRVVRVGGDEVGEAGRGYRRAGC